MKEVRILHCADLHIGAHERFLGTAAKKRRVETLLTFERILQTARENQVDLLLIAGDLFDSNTVENEWVDRIFEGFASIPEIQIVFAAGNHDPLDAQSPFLNRELPENVHLLGKTDTLLSFENLHTRVWGRSFAEVYLSGQERFSLPVENDDTINIMVQHGELLGGAGGNYNTITPEFIRTSGMDYIALGHIHKRSEPEKLGGTHYAYCGCPEGQGFDETGEKGVYLGIVRKGEVDLTFIPLCKRRHERVDIDLSSCESATAITDFILATLHNTYGEDYAENLYRITLLGALPEEWNFSTAEISARLNEKLYFAKVLSRTEVAADLERLATEPSLKGIFTRKMLAAISSADEAEKPQLRAALQLGLRAFRGEIDDFDFE